MLVKFQYETNYEIMKNKYLFLVFVIGLLSIACAQQSNEFDFVLSLFTNAKNGNREAVNEMFSDDFCNTCGWRTKEENIEELIAGMKDRELLTPDEIFWANDGSIHYYDKKYVHGRQLKVVIDLVKKDNSFLVSYMIVSRIKPLK